MNKKKIIYITPALPVGGAEKFLISLSAALAPLTQKQVIVSLSTVNPLEKEINPAVQFMPLPRKGKFDTGPIKTLRQLIKTERPDFIFCINFFSYFIVRMAMFGMGSKPKTIISYHSTNHLTRKEHLLHKFYSRLLYKKDLIITVSGNQTKYTAETYNIPRHQFEVIYNGIDTGYWKPADDNSARTDIRQRYELPEDAKVIVLTAAFRPEKNHLGAIRALQLLHQKEKQETYLLFVGDGPMKEEIRKTAEQTGMSKYVKMAGVQKDVRPFYWAADLFTLCSTNVETFSIAALEAMATGLPCVLTDIGGAREMIDEGTNGFICETPDQSIATAWERALQGHFSKQDIHAFTYNNFRIEKMITDYKKVLAIA